MTTVHPVDGTDLQPGVPLDLRMVPVAVAGWGAAALGTWAAAWVWAVLGAGVAGSMLLAATRRSTGWAAAAVVLLALGATGGLHTHRLATGVVAELARAGVSRISVGGAFAFAAIGAVVSAATELREQGTYGFREGSAAGAAAARRAFS